MRMMLKKNVEYLLGHSTHFLIDFVSIELVKK